MNRRQIAAFEIGRRFYRLRDWAQRAGFQCIRYARTGDVGDLILPARAVEKAFPNRGEPRPRILDLVHRP